MHHHPMPLLELVRELLSYDRETGEFKWLKKGFRKKRNVGERATTTNSRGYNVLHIAEIGRSYRAARLAWYYVTEEDPGELEVDHRNRSKIDDRLDNLRLATRSVNAVNTGFRNRSGVRGVWERAPGCGVWGAKISRAGVHRTLGQAYRSQGEAAAAYAKAAADHEAGLW